MIAEKPSWIRHGGTEIFSIDIQPGGLRFATGGGDHKVRIWNMKSVGRDLQIDDSVSKLLATLRDHFGSVNCVRWAKQGRYIASGSDSQVILIHERKPGSGTTEFGSGEPPDVENWKVAMTLRGHTADVVDLNWSPDDSSLVSGSLDNTIHVWDMANGICIAVLRSHSSLVKGVVWDPIGSFLASQSDDKTVIIWQTSDWSIAHKTEGHWAKSLGSTFFRRLDWSPCGHFITTTHGFQKPRHSAPVLERGEWSATFDFLGHNAPIIVTKFNHSMFRRIAYGAQSFKAAAVGWTNGTNGSLKNEVKDSQPYNVIAIGSQDRTITVWTTASPRPLFVAKHFFSQGVVDLSWSPDGYSLFACSLDGTVATFHFDAKEIGYKLSDAELDDLKRSRYGDVRGQQGILAESPAQLLLEETFAKQNQIKRPKTAALESQASAKPSADPILPPRITKAPVHDGKGTENPTSNGSKTITSSKVASPVKQKEYRRPDGRKRIIPEAVGVAAKPKSLEFPASSPAQNRLENVTVPNNSGAVAGSMRTAASVISDPKDHCGVTARAFFSDSLVIEKAPVDGNKEPSNLVEQIGIPNSGGVLCIRVFDKKRGDVVPVCLQARLKELPANDMLCTGNTPTIKETELSCTEGLETLWTERLSSKVTVMAGNSNFWAVGCEDGSLQIYTKCGRRALPTMMMGSSGVFIDCDESWKLLFVTRKGALYVWDIFNKKCILHDSLVSLVNSDMRPDIKEAGTIKVISAKVSQSGSPLVVLATRNAYLFDMNLMCWLRVADDCFPASNFASSWGLSSTHGGELGALQVDVRKFLARRPGWSRSIATDDGMQTRAHMEAQLASALALDSPNEYRQCLLSYVRFLSREADEPRLREVCESFLGPPTGMVESSKSLEASSWDPCVLGMNKHTLLRDDILPAMASNRKVQRLLNEFISLLLEYETPETNIQNTNPSASTSKDNAEHNDENKCCTTANDVAQSVSNAVDGSLQTSGDQHMEISMNIDDERGAPEAMALDPLSHNQGIQIQVQSKKHK